MRGHGRWLIGINIYASCSPGAVLVIQTSFLSHTCSSCLLNSARLSPGPYNIYRDNQHFVDTLSIRPFPQLSQLRPQCLLTHHFRRTAFPALHEPTAKCKCSLHSTHLFLPQHHTHHHHTQVDQRSNHQSLSTYSPMRPSLSARHHRLRVQPSKRTPMRALSRESAAASQDYFAVSAAKSAHGAE